MWLIIRPVRQTAALRNRGPEAARSREAQLGEARNGHGQGTRSHSRRASPRGLEGRASDKDVGIVAATEPGRGTGTDARGGLLFWLQANLRRLRNDHHGLLHPGKPGGETGQVVDLGGDGIKKEGHRGHRSIAPAFLVSIPQPGRAWVASTNTGVILVTAGY